MSIVRLLLVAVVGLGLAWMHTVGHNGAHATAHDGAAGTPRTTAGGSHDGKRGPLADEPVHVAPARAGAATGSGTATGAGPAAHTTPEGAHTRVAAFGAALLTAPAATGHAATAMCLAVLAAVGVLLFLRALRTAHPARPGDRNADRNVDGGTPAVAARRPPGLVPTPQRVAELTVLRI